MLFLPISPKPSIMKKRSVLFLVLLAVIFMMGLSSCAKPGSSAKKAKILFAHAAPNISALDFYLGAAKENSAAIAYQSTTAYSAVVSGAYTFMATVDSNGGTAVSTPIYLASGGNYSIFVVDTSPNISSLLLNDTLATPPSGMANIRIVDLVPNSPAFNLGVSGSNALASNLNFETNSGFIAVTPGNLILQLTLTANGTVINNFQSITLAADKAYTLCLTGIYGRGIAPVLIGNL
jgi:hypothetical protein